MFLQFLLSLFILEIWKPFEKYLDSKIELGKTFINAGKRAKHL